MRSGLSIHRRTPPAFRTGATPLATGGPCGARAIVVALVLRGGGIMQSKRLRRAATGAGMQKLTFRGMSGAQ